MSSFKIVRKENNYVVSARVVCQLEELARSVEQYGDLTFEESQRLVDKFTEGGLVKVQNDNGQVTLELTTTM